MREYSVLIRGSYYDSPTGPTIFLKLSSAAAARFLSERVSRVAGGDSPLVLCPDEHVLIENIAFLRLRLIQEPKQKQILRANGGFLWDGTAEQWEYVRELIEPFAEDQPGHQYLSLSKDDDAEIEVSLHEGLAGEKAPAR